MVAADYTFDLTPARRPSLADVGGAEKVNDAEYPPNPQTDPTAEEWNFFANAISAYGGVIPVALVEVTMIAGAPTVTAVGSPRTTITTASFTPTDNGTGDTTLTWGTGVLPPRVVRPQAWVTDDGAWCQPVALLVSATAIRVKTRNSGGTLTDASFTVAIF